jgi:hypothetical protein
MTVLHTLLKVRSVREDGASRMVARARGLCIQVEADLVAAERQLHDWRLQAQRQEAAWYADMCSRVVSQRDIERVLVQVTALRQETVEQEAGVVQARQRLDDALDALQQARAYRSRACRATRKTEHLFHADAAQRRQDLERREEDEQDEAASAAYGLRTC